MACLSCLQYIIQTLTSRNYCNSRKQCGKMKNLLPPKKIFVKSTTFYLFSNFFRKLLLSRNFCQKNLISYPHCEKNTVCETEGTKSVEKFREIDLGTLPFFFFFFCSHFTQILLTKFVVSVV